MIKLLTVSERIRLPKCKIVWVVLDDVEFWIWCCLPQPHGIWDLTNECQACVIAIFDICTSYYLDLSRERGRVFSENVFALYAEQIIFAKNGPLNWIELNIVIQFHSTIDFLYNLSSTGENPYHSSYLVTTNHYQLQRFHFLCHHHLLTMIIDDIKHHHFITLSVHLFLHQSDWTDEGKRIQ